MRNKPNIYKITNLINNKIYIGQSKFLDNNYFGSGVFIKKAIKKYGKKNFKKEIIEFCKEEELDEKERFYIKNLNSVNEGYNFLYGGTGDASVSGSKSPNSKVFFIYNLNGDLVFSGKGVKLYCRENGFNESKVLSCCRRKLFHYREQIFSYNKINKKELKESIYIFMQNKGAKNKKKVYALSPEGDAFTFYNTVSFAKEKNLSDRSIRRVLEENNNVHTHKGWQFSFSGFFLKDKELRRIRKRKIFEAISPSSEVFEDTNATAFAEEHGLSRGQIKDCLTGRQKTHKGWKFKYV